RPFPHLVDRDDARADALVLRVGECAADAGALLDRDVVAAVEQLERAGRRERNAVLVRLDLLRDTDLHAAGDPTVGAGAAVRRGSWRPRPPEAAVPRPRAEPARARSPRFHPGLPRRARARSRGTGASSRRRTPA